MMLLDFFQAIIMNFLFLSRKALPKMSWKKHDSKSYLQFCCMLIWMEMEKDQHLEKSEKTNTYFA